MKKYFQKKQTDEWTVEQKTLKRERARETEREIDRERERQRQREIDIERDRQTDRERQTYRERQTERDLGKKKEVLGFPEIFGN